MDSDRRDMARALQLAWRGRFGTHPNPRVGCVLVREGTVLASGWHQRAGEPHAERMALQALGEDNARGCTAYVTLEPCSHHGRTPPCADALIDAGIVRVVIAMEDPDPRVAGSGIDRLRGAGIEVLVGVMAAEARALNKGFVSRLERGRPWVRLKLASSLDGRTALASGESRWVTGGPARTDVQRLRAQAGAVMTGIGTVLHDDPSLNVRLEGSVLDGNSPVRQPLRVILDSRLRMPRDARLTTVPGQVLVYTANSSAVAGNGGYDSARVTLQTVVRTSHGLDLDAVMADLAAREIGELHVECGATLAGALIDAALVDELVVYMAPHLMGTDGMGLARLSGVKHMEQRRQFTWTEVRRVGRDLRLTAVPGSG